jgi:regulator of protease activity HflC (stomatin/prohibitin superfamily)
VLVLAVLVAGGVVASFVAMARSGGELGWLWLALGLLVIAVLLVLGLFMIEPNQARVLMLFGAYRGSARQPGLRFTNPFYAAREISLRTRNFETGLELRLDRQQHLLGELLPQRPLLPHRVGVGPRSGQVSREHRRHALAE